MSDSGTARQREAEAREALDRDAASGSSIRMLCVYASANAYRDAVEARVREEIASGAGDLFCPFGHVTPIRLTLTCRVCDNDE